VLLAVLVPQTVPAAEPAGAVTDARGTVTASAGEASRTLILGADVFVGDTVRTGPQSRATLKLGKRTNLKLGPDTNIHIDRYLADAGGDIDLLQGAVLFERKGPPASDPLNFKSAYGLIAVRGTRFYAGTLNDKFGVLVGTGRVEVTGGGKAVTVNPQEGTEIAAPGAAPSPPGAWKLSRIKAFKALFE
jgi:ferric-dicitrate binding protein FerR (iron transport regulator)